VPQDPTIECSGYGLEGGLTHFSTRLSFVKDTVARRQVHAVEAVTPLELAYDPRILLPG
jgi:hypothetical protein